MGDLKNLRSGDRNVKTDISETVSPTDEGGGGVPPEGQGCQPRLANSEATFEALLGSIDAPANRWPEEMLRVVRRTRKRLPRGGWNTAFEFFRGRFPEAAKNPSHTTFRKKAEMAQVNEAGRACTASEFREECKKRMLTVLETFSAATTAESKAALEIAKTFKKIMKDLKDSEIEEFTRTRKVSSEEIDNQILGAVIEAGRGYANESHPTTMLEIAKCIQAVQCTYQAATSRLKCVSTWQKSIEEKILRWENTAKLLERAKTVKLTREEKSEVKSRLNQLGLSSAGHPELETGIARSKEKAAIYTRKIETHQRRKQFRQANKKFELRRGMFYRHLEEEEKVEHSVPEEEIRDFWSRMWVKRPEPERDRLDEYLLEYLPEEGQAQNLFPSFEEFMEIVSWLPSWKAAGPDGIYNFFVKKCDFLHKPIYEACARICMGGEVEGAWFYKGLTYLLPKGKPKKGSDFRPITCMSNLYKLLTKCVTKVMQTIVEGRQLLAENQLGTVRRTQGAKEQALLNIAINRANKNSLKAAWIDVKKAYDSVDHRYLLKAIERCNFPRWVSTFLASITSKWELKITVDGKHIMNKKVERGILQGDSLSPLLFVLCMDPLSRRLNGTIPMITVPTPEGNHICNHLLFIDDLKLLARNGKDLKAAMDETKSFFEAIGLEINFDKSATNAEVCADDAKLLEGAASYKYLGVTEDPKGEPKPENVERIREEILKRVKTLCNSGLNAKNLFKAINEYAISVINYHIGVLRISPEEFNNLDRAIKQVLTEHKVHYQPGCKERLYLPRTAMGRGLISVEARSESMLLELFESLDRDKAHSTRRAAILKVELDDRTHLSLIKPFLAAKYNLNEEPNRESLREAQTAYLYSKIQNKDLHKMLFRYRANELANERKSSTWLCKGNITPQDEAVFCYLQDRNLFWGSNSTCVHCREAIKTVDHLATACKRMLGHDYMRRHNEVVRCIHMGLCNKYGFKKSRRIRSHSVQQVIDNENATIFVDTRINTNVLVKHNKPDIVVIDKKRKQILIVEIGITNQNDLTLVENEKARKYDLLAGELELVYKSKAKIVPYVMTWEGIVTSFHEKYLKELEIEPRVEAYIQGRVLKKTLEAISFDKRRGFDEQEAVEERPEMLVRRLLNPREEAPTENPTPQD